MSDDPIEKPSPVRVEQILGIVVLALLLIGCMLVVQPFVSSLMWAGVLCFSLWPVQLWLTARLQNRRTLASLFMTLTMALTLVLPFVVIGIRLADDARSLTTAAQRWAANGPPPAPAWMERIPLVGSRVSSYFSELSFETAQFVRQLSNDGDEIAFIGPTSAPTTAPTTEPSSQLGPALRQLVSSVRSVLITAGLAVVGGVAQVALSVFLTFFIFRDGQALADRLNAGITRIAGERGSRLLVLAGNTVRGVVYGILGTALVQGILAGIGLAIAGVPGAALLGLATFFLSVLPVGPPLIWIPATIWLFNTYGTGWGVFMLIWGIGVSSVDNVVKPWLISQGSDMPFIVILIGVLGGAMAFGLIGVFLGPTLLAVAYRLIADWSSPAAVGSIEITKPSTLSSP